VKRTIHLLILLIITAKHGKLLGVDFLYASMSDNSIVRYDVSSNDPVTIQNSMEIYINNINDPMGLTFDRSGNLYVSNYSVNTISKIDSTKSVSVFANFNQLYPFLVYPTSLAFDHTNYQNSNIYLANSSNNRIVALNSTGSASLFSTIDTQCFGLVFDNTGNLFATNSGSSYSSVSRIDTSGNSTNYAIGLNNPMGITIDQNGNLYASNPGNNTISKITQSGNVLPFLSGLNYPYGITSDSAGYIYIANPGNSTISKVDTLGHVLSNWNTGTSTPRYLTIQPAPEPSTWHTSLLASFLLITTARVTKQRLFRLHWNQH